MGWSTKNEVRQWKDGEIMLKFLKARNQQQDDTHNIDDKNKQSRLVKSDARGHIQLAFELEVFVEDTLFRFRKLYNLLNFEDGYFDLRLVGTEYHGREWPDGGCLQQL